VIQRPFVLTSSITEQLHQQRLTGAAAAAYVLREFHLPYCPRLFTTQFRGVVTLYLGGSRFEFHTSFMSSFLTAFLCFVFFVSFHQGD
jgi:hypothetical protein